MGTRTQFLVYLFLPNRTNSFLQPQGDRAKVEAHQSLSQRVRLDQELGVVGLHCLMPQGGGVMPQNTALVVAGGENFLPAQAQAESHTPS